MFFQAVNTCNVRWMIVQIYGIMAEMRHTAKTSWITIIFICMSVFEFVLVFVCVWWCLYMYADMYVCMYECMFVCMYVFMYVYVCGCSCICLCLCVCVCLQWKTIYRCPHGSRVTPWSKLANIIGAQICRDDPKRNQMQTSWADAQCSKKPNQIKQSRFVFSTCFQFRCAVAVPVC